MTLPAVRAVGTVASSITTASPGLPTGTTTNDICIIFSETAAQAVTWSGGNQTWTEVYGSPQDQAGNTRITAHWARIDSASPTMPTSNDPGDHIICRAISFSGAATTGIPFDLVATTYEAAVDTTGAFLGNSTQVADCLIVQAMACSLPDAAAGTANFSGETNATLGSLTERIDNNDNVGNGGALGCWTGTLAAAGAFGATTVTLATASGKAMMTMALRPATAATTDLRCHRLLDGGLVAAQSSYTTGTTYAKTAGRPVIMNICTRLAAGSIPPTTVTVSSGETPTLIFSSPGGVASTFHIYGFIATSSGTFTATFDYAGVNQIENIWSAFEVENGETGDGILGLFVNGTRQNMYNSLTNGNARDIALQAVSNAANATLVFAFCGGPERDFTPAHGETLIQQASAGAATTTTICHGYKVGGAVVTGTTWSGTSVSNGIGGIEIRAAGVPQPKISQSVLTASFDNTDSLTYTTASISPTANTGLILAFCANRSAGGGPQVPTLSGGPSVSWTQEADVTSNTIATPNSRLTVWSAQSGDAPGSGAITFTTVTNVDICAVWAVIEISGQNVTDFVLQPTTNRADAGANPSVTLAAFGNTANGTLGLFNYDAAVLGESTGEGAGFLRIVKQTATVPSNTLAVQFRNSNDTSVDQTATSSDWAAVALELVASLAPPMLETPARTTWPAMRDFDAFTLTGWR